MGNTLNKDDLVSKIDIPTDTDRTVDETEVNVVQERIEPAPNASGESLSVSGSGTADGEVIILHFPLKLGFSHAHRLFNNSPLYLNILFII